MPASVVTSWGRNVNEDPFQSNFTSGPITVHDPSGSLLLLKVSFCCLFLARIFCRSYVHQPLQLQASPWASINPSACQLTVESDSSLSLKLSKSSSALGSWPHPFQSLELSTSVPHSPNGLHLLFSHDKEVYNHRANQLLKSHMFEAQALRSAFAASVIEQMAVVPTGALGQTAFVFPTEGPHNLKLLNESCHLKSVKKLLLMADAFYGGALLHDLAEGPQLRPLASILGCFIAGLAAVEHYAETNGIEALRAVNACVGLGAGTYAAAVFSGCIRLTDVWPVLQAHAAALESELHSKMVVIKSVAASLAGIQLRPPRIRLYTCDGTLAESVDDLIASLPRALCANPPQDWPWSETLMVYRALMQQGVATFIDPLRLGAPRSVDPAG